MTDNTQTIFDGCGKEFDIDHYGYVICGETYPNVFEAGKSNMVLCQTCKTKISQRKADCEEELSFLEGIGYFMSQADEGKKNRRIIYLKQEIKRCEK